MIVLLDEVSTFMDYWIDWKEKLFKLAKIELVTRPVLIKLLRSLPECDDLPNPNGNQVLWEECGETGCKELMSS